MSFTESLLLATKQYMPSSPGPQVARDRLTDRLRAAMALPLTLVAAPAGFGKTTLVSDWVRRTGLRAAWLSLDDGDNDPTRFWTYVAAALHQVDARLGGAALAMLRSPQPPPPEAVLSALINEAAALPERVSLILDDYHLITTRTIHDGMVYLLEHLPEQLRLVVLTRADPPFPLARLRVRGQLAELRAADLRFTPSEAAAFFHDVMDLPLTPAEIATLDARTEGWAAALQLAALSLQGRGSTAELVAGFTGQHHFVLDYIMDEVLQGQGPDVQRFLMQTAVLDRLCGPLCDALTGATDGQEMLERLARANLFVVPLDDQRRWFRYHHLFADVLRARLQGQAQALHARAARWFDENGLPAPAVTHALAAGDTTRAAALVERLAIPMLTAGELATLQAWLAALPPGEIAARPWLGVARAWALTLTGRVPDLPEMTCSDPLLQGHVAALRAYGAAMSGNPGAAIAFGGEALRLLPPDEGTVRPVVGYVLGGIAYHAGNLEAAATAFAEAGRSGNGHLAISARGALGGVRVTQGRLREAAEIFRETAGCALPAAGGALARLGEIHREWNDLETALDYIQRGLAQSRPGAHAEALVARYLGLARVHVARQDLPAAAEALRQAEEQLAAQPVSPLVTAEYDAARVELWLARGDLTAAAGWLQQQPDGVAGFIRERAEIARARVLIALGRATAAVPPLADLAAAAEAGGRLGVLIEVLVVQADALRRTGDEAGARGALARARRLAEPEGYVRIFLEGENAPLAEPPSPRELEILRLIAAGLTNEEIAARLFLSVLTVKRHISNLYGKLGAKSRTQALALARELGLL